MFTKLFFFLSLGIGLLLHTHSVQAQDLGLESVAPLVGLTYTPEHKEAGLITGITANFGELREGVEIYPTFYYWYGEKNNHKRSSIQFSLDAKYFFASSSGFYAGGGLSGNYISEKSDRNSKGETKFQPGGALLVGNEQFTGKNIWFIQLKLDVLNDFKAISLSTGLFFDLYR